MANCTKASQSMLEDMLVAFCNGYIEAAVAVMVLMNGQYFCMPLDTPSQDLVDAAVAFLRAHPDYEQYMFASVMLTAAEAQWPCRSK